MPLKEVDGRLIRDLSVESLGVTTQKILEYPLDLARRR